MAVQSRAALKSDKNTAFADNTTGDISAADMRGEFEDLIDSVYIPGDDNTGDNLLMTAAERSKLAGVEAGATADQTGAEIKTAYEAEPNTNAFTDAEKTKLAGLEASLFKGNYVNLTALQTAHPSPEVGAYAYVDPGIGTDVVLYIWDDDDTAWVQSGGSGTTETPASVKSKYESNPDTNAFTDAYKAKLDGITEVPDPPADAIAFFDFSTGDVAYFTSMTGLSISGTTLTADVQSVAGLTGAISASGLRTAINVEDGATADQSNAEIETAYNAQVGQVSAGEKTAGTETAVRRFAPQDIHDMIDNHAPGGGGGDAWSDPVDAVITPDADGTRDLATTGTRFATGYLDNLDITSNITVGGTVDGVDVAAVADVAQTEVVTVCLYEAGEDVATGDKAGNQVLRIPAKLNGYNLTGVAAYVDTAGTTGTTDIQIHNITDTADMLSTVMTIDSGETDTSTAAAAAVIDAANDDVATGDKIRFDVDAVATTAPQGLWVELTFEAP